MNSIRTGVPNICLPIQKEKTMSNSDDINLTKLLHQTMKEGDKLLGKVTAEASKKALVMWQRKEQVKALKVLVEDLETLLEFENGLLNVWYKIGKDDDEVDNSDIL